MAFEKKTPPPIVRAGREKAKLNEEEAKELLDTLVADKDAENPWLFDTKEYNTRAAAQARVLWYRGELHRIFPKRVTKPKQIQSRVVDAASIGGTAEKFRFGLRYRDAKDVPDEEG